MSGDPGLTDPVALFDELYIKIALILSGVFFVVIAFPLAWRYITCK